MWNSGGREDKQEAYRSLSDVDKEAADLYAEWYECSPEDVAVIQSKTKDWDKTAEKLEQDFFYHTGKHQIPDGKGGILSGGFGRSGKAVCADRQKAMDLAKKKAKGKYPRIKKWSEVVKDSEILTTEEQLGLTKEQSKRLKDRKLSREERIDVAILLLNRTFTFDEVTEELDAGKTVEELVKQDIH